MRALLAALLAICALTVVACGGGSGKTTPATPASGVATQTPTAPPTVEGSSRRTGIAEVDAIINAVLSGDPEQLRPLVRFQPMACTATPQGIGPFYCATAEQDGAVHQLLPAAECEGFFIDGDDPTSLNGVVKQDQRLYAVTRTEAQYTVIFAFESAGAPGQTFGSSITIESGRVTAVNFGCGQTPDEYVARVQPQDFVLPPP